MTKKRKTGFWILISMAVLLVGMLFLGQTLSLFDYDLAVELGLQESVKEIGKIGIAYSRGFAFGDTVAYIPLLLIGIIGLLKRKPWGLYSLFGSLSITVYWPIIHLFTIYTERTEITLTPDKMILFSIILPLVAIYGLWGMWYLVKNHEELLRCS